MFSSTGTRSESEIGRLWLKTFSPARGGFRASLAVKIDAKRMRGRERFEDANIAHRHRGRVDLAVVDGKGGAIPRREPACLRRLMRGGNRLIEAVNPAAHDLFDGAVKRCAVGVRRLALVAPDDEIERAPAGHRERTDRKARTLPLNVVARYSPIAARILAVVAIARHIDEN